MIKLRNLPLREKIILAAAILFLFGAVLAAVVPLIEFRLHHESPTRLESQTCERLRTAINRERGALKIPSLNYNAHLEQAAYVQSDFQAQKDRADHYGENRSTWADRCKEAGYPGASLGTIGEIVAGWQVSPEEAVADWMKSPGHRACILDRRYEDCGGGMATNHQSGKSYWTVDFGMKPRDGVKLKGQHK